MSLMSACYACRRTFMSNPSKVPSYENQPICRNCITLVNERRRTLDLPLWPVDDDAYILGPEDE